MDDLSNLMNQLGGAAGAGGTDPGAAPGGLANALQGEGGLDGLMGKLRDAGLGDQVDSCRQTRSPRSARHSVGNVDGAA